MSQLESKYRGLLKSNQAFAGNMYNATATRVASSGNFSYLQLYNPTASGHYLLINQIDLFSSTQTSLTLGLETAVIGSDTGATTNVSTVNGISSDPTTELRTHVSSISLPGTLISHANLAGTGVNNLILPYTVLLDEATGLTVLPSTTNLTLSGTFSYIRVEK